jgi:hypothetical protein
VSSRRSQAHVSLSPEQAMRWLDRSYERRDPGLIQVGSDPLFKPLRADPQFLAFLDKLKAVSRTLDGH